MKTPEKYPISRVEKSIGDKFEQAPDVPIAIDVIRHDTTPRKQNKEGFHRASLLNVDIPNFKLDEEYLDLDKKGIASMEASANQLADLIDREKEIVLIVSSPAWRTHSSALVTEKVLRERGISILNEGKNFKFSKAINQHSSFFEKIVKRDFGDNSQTRQVIEDYIKKGFKEGFKSASEILHISEEEMERRMDEAETLSFQKFLRHMNNIYKFLHPETLDRLKGKKLRIVVFAHEETTRGFIKEIMQDNSLSQSNGQILEIIPESKLST